jgi:hypothetical protein
LQFDVIADISRIVEDSTARLDQMPHQEIAETFLKMGAISRRFLARGELLRQPGSTTVFMVPLVVLHLRLD